jgi:hypothetical protein
MATMILSNQDEMRKLYRGPSTDASYQVSVDMVKRFQRRIFLEIDQPETRIMCAAMLDNGQDKMSNLYRGPSIDASNQFPIHFAERFQRRRLKWEKLNRQHTPSDGKSSHDLSASYKESLKVSLNSNNWFQRSKALKVWMDKRNLGYYIYPLLC